MSTGSSHTVPRTHRSGHKCYQQESACEYVCPYTFVHVRVCTRACVSERVRVRPKARTGLYTRLRVPTRACVSLRAPECPYARLRVPLHTCVSVRVRVVTRDPDLFLPFIFLVAKKWLYKSLWSSVGRSEGPSRFCFFGLLGATYGRVSDLVMLALNCVSDPLSCFWGPPNPISQITALVPYGAAAPLLQN